jgi:spore coat protein H
MIVSGTVSGALLAALLMAGCGGGPDGPDDPGVGSDGSVPDGGAIPDGGGGGPSLSDQELETAQGCPGVYNPDQVLDYYIDIAPADWSALLNDQTNSVYFPASLRCGDEPAITVGVRRKRSGGTSKPGLKVDFNELVPGQAFYGLRKFSLENGVSEGSSEDDTPTSDYLAEYLSWRMMVRSGMVTGRAVFARVFVNDELVGVYVNVEQVDKRFLRHRLGDDTGWLYKKSGGAGDGLKTHENDGLINPYEEYFCFWRSGNACPVPSAQDLAQDLPSRLNIDQILRYGAVNAIIANADSLLFKDNNYY